MQIKHKLIFFITLCTIQLFALERPNVIVILTDDQGWGDLSINGNLAIDTPNIDRLAWEGAQFEHFYVSPVCSPTRAEFLTGRHHVRCGVYDTSEGAERCNSDETMIGELFRRAGYKTAAFGKWHNGMQYPYHPNARGFDEFYGFCSGHWGNYYSPMLEHNGEIVQGNGFVIDDFTERAMKYIEQNKEEPFFVYIPYNTPHSPMQVPDRWWNKFKDRKLNQDFPKKQYEKIDHTRAALAMCENIDWNVGRLMEKLDELELADHTIVIYFCDNGPNGERWNGGMRGRKGSTDEGGVRSPLFLRWPDKVKPGTQIQQICSAMDLLPTLADMANVDVVGTKPLDGISLAPLLFGHFKDWQERTLVHHWEGRISVRTQRYRLDHEGRLYDMIKDPTQNLLINEHEPEATQSLNEVVRSFRATMLKNYGKQFDHRPFVIGHPDALKTHVPARDGIGKGHIRRSCRWPNDSFFQNWTSLDDSITWDCEVGQTGTYKVELFYTCSKADIGSTVQLSFNDEKLVGKIIVPNDPPLTGMEEDRFVREESYVKDFKPMTLGTIYLRKGAGTLKLKALEITGSEVMDLRLMLLTRMDV
ncbi:MAG: N-acetylgalactosamine 6-sulfate sulfatase [Kiritimatiellaceae bacterium]|nr:N-acetylgalactosamine 6-sulfate sulfatase [Kiritimatiellaceae bacterium]